MKVKELIEKLQEMPQDLEVFSICDHGQTPEKSMSPSICYIDPFDKSNYTYDKEDAEEYGYTNTVVLL